MERTFTSLKVYNLKVCLGRTYYTRSSHHVGLGVPCTAVMATLINTYHGSVTQAHTYTDKHTCQESSHMALSVSRTHTHTHTLPSPHVCTHSLVHASPTSLPFATFCCCHCSIAKSYPELFATPWLHPRQVS